MREATRYSMRKQQHAWGYEIFHEKTTTYVRLQDIPWENNNMREATRYSMRKQQLAWFDLFDSLTYSWQVQVYKQNNKDLDIQMALWIYVVIVTNEIDDTIELSRGRMLWLSRMKRMTLSNCHVDVCCDCHEWNRWHYRIVTWTYVVIVTNEIDDTIELSHGRMLWL
jgi:hypothetical protein